MGEEIRLDITTKRASIGLEQLDSKAIENGFAEYGVTIGLADLPESVIALVLSWVSPRELAKLSLINCTFFRASQSDVVWDKMLPPQYSKILKLVSNTDMIQYNSKRALYDCFCSKLLLEDGTQEYWVDAASGHVCRSLSGKALSILGIHERDRMWEWIPAKPGSRFPEVAYTSGADRIEVSGNLECWLPPGSYLLSWRLQVGVQPIYRAIHGTNTDFTLQHTMPYRFTLWTSDGWYQESERYLDCMNRPEGDDKWLEYDGGEFVVETRDRPIDLRFSLAEMSAGVWRSGLLLDCVVIRPTHLTRKNHQKVEVVVADQHPRPEMLLYLPTSRARWGRLGALSRPSSTREKKDGNCVLVTGPFP